MNKKEFMQMLAKGDVDDTTEFWESIYDSIHNLGRKETVEELKKILIGAEEIIRVQNEPRTNPYIYLSDHLRSITNKEEEL